MTLTTEQRLAVDALKAHCLETTTNPFMVLEGPAGSGKTYCLATLARELKRKMVFTAPTNKAVRVLREAVHGEDYKPECRTTYSLLGLQLLANGEVKELRRNPETDVDLSDVRVVVVDEGSMVSKVLMAELVKTSQAFPRLRFILQGDRWQLPPVGEDMSECWKVEHRVELKTIMRQDNTILSLASHVRELVEKPFKKLVLTSTADVSPLTPIILQAAVIGAANDFLKGKAKFISWRNVIVDQFNHSIRQELFAEANIYPWQEGDRITVLEPVKDLEDNIVATTDEEGTVQSADIREHPIYTEFKCWRIVMQSDFNKTIVLWSLLQPTESAKFAEKVARLAADAKASPRLWGNFWEFKEAFHAVRHAYAITAHRAQGSTYEDAYVNWRDILRNPNNSEAYRCLYVAVTRPKRRLYLG